MEASFEQYECEFIGYFEDGFVWAAYIPERTKLLDREFTSEEEAEEYIEAQGLDMLLLTF